MNPSERCAAVRRLVGARLAERITAQALTFHCPACKAELAYMGEAAGVHAYACWPCSEVWIENPTLARTGALRDCPQEVAHAAGSADERRAEDAGAAGQLPGDGQDREHEAAEHAARPGDRGGGGALDETPPPTPATQPEQPESVMVEDAPARDKLAPPKRRR